MRRTPRMLSSALTLALRGAFPIRGRRHRPGRRGVHDAGQDQMGAQRGRHERAGHPCSGDPTTATTSSANGCRDNMEPVPYYMNDRFFVVISSSGGSAPATRSIPTAPCPRPPAAKAFTKPAKFTTQREGGGGGHHGVEGGGPGDDPPRRKTKRERGPLNEVGNGADPVSRPGRPAAQAFVW